MESVHVFCLLLNQHIQTPTIWRFNKFPLKCHVIINHISILFFLQECTLQWSGDQCGSSKFSSWHIEATHWKDSNHADFKWQLPLPQQPGVSVDVFQFTEFTECWQFPGSFQPGWAPAGRELPHLLSLGVSDWHAKPEASRPTQQQDLHHPCWSHHVH